MRRVVYGNCEVTNLFGTRNIVSTGSNVCYWHLAAVRVQWLKNWKWIKVNVDLHGDFALEMEIVVVLPTFYFRFFCFLFFFISFDCNQSGWERDGAQFSFIGSGMVRSSSDAEKRNTKSFDTAMAFPSVCICELSTRCDATRCLAREFGIRENSP